MTSFLWCRIVKISSKTCGGAQVSTDRVEVVYFYCFLVDRSYSLSLPVWILWDREVPDNPVQWSESHLDYRQRWDDKVLFSHSACQKCQSLLYISNKRAPWSLLFFVLWSIIHSDHFHKSLLWFLQAVRDTAFVGSPFASKDIKLYRQAPIACLLCRSVARRRSIYFSTLVQCTLVVSQRNHGTIRPNFKRAGGHVNYRVPSAQRPTIRFEKDLAVISWFVRTLRMSFHAIYYSQ